MKFEHVDVNTVTVTHIFDGEEVVRGGEDGQVWIATFASQIEANSFISYLHNHRIEVTGIRNNG